MSDRLYDTHPLAIELRALINAPNGDPMFDWLTVTVDSIEAVSRARTDTGGGASVRLKTGHTLLVSNSYEDVAEAILGDAKRFPNCELTEAEMLRPPSAEEVAEMLEARRRAQAEAEAEAEAEGDAPPDITSALGLVEDEDDEGGFEEFDDEILDDDLYDDQQDGGR